MTVAVLAVVLVVALGPGLARTVLPTTGAHPGAARPTRPLPKPTPAVLSWPQRGDLIGELGFLDDVRRFAQQLGGDRYSSVLFAGWVAGGRLVVLATPVPHAPDVVDTGAVFVPPGGGLGQAEYAGLAGISGPDDVVTWVRRTGRSSGPGLPEGPPGPGGWVSVLVLGGLGLTDVEVSADVRYGRDGGARRSWLKLPVQHGVAMAQLPPPALGVVAVRTAFGVRSRAAVPVPLPPAPPGTGGQAPLAVTGLDAKSYRGATALEVRRVVQDVAPGLGPTSSPPAARVAWSGQLGERVRATIVVLRRRDGAAFQLLVAEKAVGVGAAISTSLYTAGPRPVPWALADSYPWVVPGGPGDEGPRRLVNPSSSASVELVARPVGARIVRVPPKGVSLVNSDLDVTGATLLLRTSGGGVLARMPAYRRVDADPLLLDPS